MGLIGQQLTMEEDHISTLLISVISLYGNSGIPLNQVEIEFETVCGFPIPWRKFKAQNLRSWIITLPFIYIVQDDNGRDILIESGPIKSEHIKELVANQKRPHTISADKKTERNANNKRRANYEDDNDDDNDIHPAKKQMGMVNYGEISFLHTSVNHTSSSNNSNDGNIEENNQKVQARYEQLESMLPLFYRHQALGDDFFVDIADTKLGYYVPNKTVKKTGLCVAGQKIADLTKRVKNAKYLAPRVVVMIGFADLAAGHSISTMITDLRELVVELKRRNTRITLLTLIPSPKLINFRRLETRMDIYNRAILDYTSDPMLSCNVIDMNTIFLKEAERFKRDFDRFTKIAKNDPYKVFSDYGRKTFLGALKSCLREQIEYEYQE